MVEPEPPLLSPETIPQKSEHLLSGSVGRWIVAILVGCGGIAFATSAMAAEHAGPATPSGTKAAAAQHSVTTTSIPAGSQNASSALSTTSTSVAPTAAPASATFDTNNESDVSALINQVEQAGVDPGPDWSWSMGNPSAQCGPIVGGELATGCTYWMSGVVKSVFSGSPTLALVAHEVANAETEADAGPALLSQVSEAEADSSWSPTDAVASCLVEHFLGIQDNAAGSWQCPNTLADLVAENIHATIPLTTTDATCGTSSGLVSTLTFNGTSGTLTVTGPAIGSVPQTVNAGTPVTVSGIGSFSAVDQGGSVNVTGVCEG